MPTKTDEKKDTKQLMTFQPIELMDSISEYIKEFNGRDDVIGKINRTTLTRVALIEYMKNHPNS